MHGSTMPTPPGTFSSTLISCLLPLGRTLTTPALGAGHDGSKRRPRSRRLDQSSNCPCFDGGGRQTDTYLRIQLVASGPQDRRGHSVRSRCRLRPSPEPKAVSTHVPAWEPGWQPPALSQACRDSSSGLRRHGFTDLATTRRRPSTGLHARVRSVGRPRLPAALPCCLEMRVVRIL